MLALLLIGLLRADPASAGERVPRSSAPAASIQAAPTASAPAAQPGPNAAAQSIAAAPASPAADAHLIAGAELFRTEKFSEALIEFQVAQKLGARDAAWYVASALVKLERPGQALEAFADADALAPESRDALLDYYRGVACYQERLYTCADGLLTSAQAQAGPKIAALVKQLRGRISPVLAPEPPTHTIDFYLARSRELREAKRLSLSALYAQEALALANRRADAYRRSDAEAELGLAKGSADRTATSP